MLNTLAFVLALQTAPTVKTGFNPAKPEISNPYWQNALREVYKSSEEILAQIKRDRRRGVFLPLLVRGNPEKKEIALTFDDGPHPDGTLALLKILKEKKVTATFFVIGKMVQKYPELARAIARDGHTLGNHTFSHVTLTKIPEPYVEAEWRAAQNLIFQKTGVRPRFCRPPGGDYDAGVIHGASLNSLTVTLWTDDPGDFSNPGAAVIEKRTLDHISNGGIILLHDGVKQTLQMLPQIIDYARKEGYTFVTLGKLRAEASLLQNP
jgi:peptidoglycan/xylan/chitin deacetylase (PgdA/CDA1 family)